MWNNRSTWNEFTLQHLPNERDDRMYTNVTVESLAHVCMLSGCEVFIECDDINNMPSVINVMAPVMSTLDRGNVAILDW